MLAARKFLLTIFSILLLLHLSAQTQHPHILVNDSDREKILTKIQNQSWAKSVYDEMVQSVEPYVQRHKTEPEWILGRYQMYRTPGKRYTKVYSDDEGTALVRFEGDAPVPTVKVSSHKRSPITSDGYGYKMPTIEELKPNDTSTKMLLTSNAPNGKKELVDPQAFTEGINGKINQLALDASIIYWLTKKEEYAKFAADIVDQWAKGASYQEPVIGPCRTGFLSIQSLGDGKYESLTLAYDFLFSYIHQHYETNFYEKLFDRIAHTMTFRGYWNNNWFAAQTPAMVFAALSLENKKQRDFYLSFYLTKDTMSDACGHLAIPSVIKRWLTPDGHWKEPGGYHNFPVSSLLTSAFAMENNGYNIFGKHPALLQSSYVLLKYSFPNFIAPSIGDTGPVTQSSECLELGLLMAKKYRLPVADQLVAAMDVMIKQKGYKRESADFMGLLTFLPEIPSSSNIIYQWPRSGALDFAKCYIQRNGASREHGMMYLVQGASYNHNHANGMALELYGAGSVMGIDPGKGITYEAPMHVNYYAQFAAHNTVTAGAQSGSVPFFRGGGGTKKIGAISLASMEPYAEKKAVSPYCSFTDTRYEDISTSTKQQRTLGIIRTSDSSGYYIDVYRSAHPSSNEYIYHNIGNKVELFDEGQKLLKMKKDSFPYSTSPLDPPGFRLIKDYQSLAPGAKTVKALFSLTEKENRNRYMQVLFAPSDNRMFYTGMAPASGTADQPYRSMLTPVVIAQQHGEAWKQPFIAVFEPYYGDLNSSVTSIQWIDSTQKDKLVIFAVSNKDQSRQTIFQSPDAEKNYQQNNLVFQGNFAVISTISERVQYLYLGSGRTVGNDKLILESTVSKGSANVELKGEAITYSANQQTLLKIKEKSKVSATLKSGGKTTPVIPSRQGNWLVFRLPAAHNAELKLSVKAG